MSAWAAIGLAAAFIFGASFVFTVICLLGARAAKWLMEVMGL